MSFLPPLRLTGATILREGELRQRSVAIERGRIGKGPLPAVSLDGYLILPGIVDLMAEIPLCPGPAGNLPERRLRLAQTRLAAAGITTAWLATPWSWPQSYGDPDGACDMLAALADLNGAGDLRAALRIEVSRTADPAKLLTAIRKYRPAFAWLQNRSAALDDLLQTDPEAFANEARMIGLQPDPLAAMIGADQKLAREVPRHLCRLAETLDDTRALYGSLDDSGGDVRETWSMLGAHLAVCPESYAAAAAGQAMGCPVLLSPEDTALNNDLMRAGLCTALVSRGRPQMLVARLLQLAGPGFRDLPKLWPLVSSTPAEIAGLADRGTLDYGRRADLVIIRKDRMAVEATVSGGKLIFLTGELRNRFLRMGDRFSPPIAAE